MNEEEFNEFILDVYGLSIVSGLVTPSISQVFEEYFESLEKEEEGMLPIGRWVVNKISKKIGYVVEADRHFSIIAYVEAGEVISKLKTMNYNLDACEEEVCLIGLADIPLMLNDKQWFEEITGRM